MLRSTKARRQPRAAKHARTQGIGRGRQSGVRAGCVAVVPSGLLMWCDTTLPLRVSVSDGGYHISHAPLALILQALAVDVSRMLRRKPTSWSCSPRAPGPPPLQGWSIQIFHSWTGSKLHVRPLMHSLPLHTHPKEWSKHLMDAEPTAWQATKAQRIVCATRIWLALD